MYKIAFVLLILNIAGNSITGQKMISDSLFIKFGKEKHEPVSLFVDSVIDKRNIRANCVAINEIKRYLFIPVDQFVVTKKPIADEIHQMFTQRTDSLMKNSYKLEIKEFVVGTTDGFFSTQYNCIAALSLYSIDSVKKQKYLGTLLYENLGSPKRNKRILKNGYEMIIDTWKNQFSSDIKNITSFPSSDLSSVIPNFRKEQFTYKKDVLLNVEYMGSINSWLLDGEIIFSSPEAQKKFIRQAYSLRYRNDKKYESFETTVSNHQVNYRLSANFLFTLKSKMFFGLNRWRDDEYAKHGLEDLFLLNYSLSQQIILNRFYKKGLTLGLGVMEDLTYIYSQNLSFKPYFIVQIGCKF